MDSVAAVSAGIALFNYFLSGVNSTLAHGLDASPALLAHTDEVIE
jgi:lipase chaperone LimK